MSDNVVTEQEKYLDAIELIRNEEVSEQEIFATEYGNKINPCIE